jgi:hypothetical protein
MNVSIKMVHVNGDSNNPAVMTFNTDDESGDVAAARCAALIIDLAQKGYIASFTIQDIVYREGDAGSYTSAAVAKPLVQAFLNAAGVITSTAAPALFPNNPIVGGAYGISPTQLPLGTSVLVNESASSGPKGRLFLPFPPPSINDEDTGIMKNVSRNTIAEVVSAHYGLLDDNGSGGEVGKHFGVRSRKLNTREKIIGLAVSNVFATLSSRKR